jgi:hypothetical protein
MSLRAIVEVVLHLESFRNVDLYFQGLYYVTVRLAQRHSVTGARTHAQPYCHFTSHAQQERAEKQKTKQ